MYEQRPRITATLRFGASGVQALAARIIGGTVATDENGFSDAAITLDMPLGREQARYYQQVSGPKPSLIVAAAGRYLYEGRVESPSYAANGMPQLVCVGYQNAYRQFPYTGLWSTTSVAEFRPILTTEIAGSVPDRYTMDTQNRVYITANKNAILGTTGTNKVGYMAYIAPNSGARLITNISFDYAFSSQTNWQIGINTFDSSWGSAANLWLLAGAGAGTVTGSQSLTLGTPRDRVALYLYYNAADAAVAAETGDIFVRITNIRIKTTTTATVYADEIARALNAHVAAVNGSQVSTNTANIESPSLDLRDETYEDTDPADILNKLALLGDNQTPPNRFEWQVWEDKVLHFRRRGLRNQTYYIRAEDLTITRNESDIINSTYATYQDASGRTLRTPIDTESDAISYGQIVRRAAVAVQTGSSLQAEVTADALRLDKRRPQARIQFVVNSAYNSAGYARVSPWWIRAGDTIKLRNIPAFFSNLDGIRSFRVIRTELDLATGAMSITPDNPAPILEMLLARREERLI